MGTPHVPKVELSPAVAEAAPPPGFLRLLNINGVLNSTTDGVTYTPVGSGGGFGADTLVQLPNSGATLVNAWEQIISLSTNTPGAEVSQVVLKLLAAGAQTVEMTVTPTTITLVPSLVLPTGSQAAPAISFAGDPTTGFYHVGVGILGITSGNTAEFTFTLGVLTITQSNAQLAFGAGGANIQLSTGSLLLTPQAGFSVLIAAARFQEKRGAAVASATTLTVGTDGNEFPITGTTTINGITTAGWQAGARVSLELVSGITITHNSGAPGGGAVAILLRAAANLTTAKAYLLELRYNGTNWVQPD